MSAIAVGGTTPARRRISTWIAVGLLALGLAMIGFLLVAQLLPGTGELAYGFGIGDILLGLASMAVWSSMLLTGTVLAILRPRNPIGWLLLVAGFSVAYTFFAPEYVQRAIALGWPLPGVGFIDWVSPVFDTLGVAMIATFIPLLFPDGRLLGPRWRPIAWLTGITMAIGIGLAFLTDNDDEFGRILPNPTALGGAAEELAENLSGILMIVLFGCIVLALASVVVRFRRSDGVERQQMKWFVWAMGLFFLSLLGMTIFFVLEVEAVSGALFFVNQILIGLVPIAIGIAILRYRLYEIDRIISRTIGWAIVTLLLVGAFALLVIGSSAVLEPLTGGNTLAVAGSTLVVALLFNPVRSRVQGAVDRRFDRSRYDGERTLAAFGERLRDEVDLATIRADVIGTVETSVRPARVGLWLRSHGSGR